MKKILIVDDEADITQLIKIKLEGTGRFLVRMENKGALGAQAAREFRPDLLILDICMPDMEGSEVLSRIREEADLRTVPVIFLTSMAKEEETTPNDRYAYTLLAKPVRMNRLLEVIDQRFGSAEYAG